MPLRDNEQDIIEETQDLWKLYHDKRSDWAHDAQEDREFRLGKQWTTEQQETLERRGHAPVVVNRIHPAVESAKAMLTANRPSFRVAAREDSDNRISNVISNMLSYIYDISDGRTIIRQAVDDYYVTGVGYILVYQDPLADMGKGEVKIRDVDPLDVYVDPNSRDRFFEDAENIIISRLFTKEQAAELHPMYKEAIAAASGEYTPDTVGTDRYDSVGIKFPGETETRERNEYIRGYERFYKMRETEYRVFEKFTGKEFLLNPEEFQEYISKEGGILEGRVFQSPEEVEAGNRQQAQLREQMLRQSYSQLNDGIQDMKEEVEVQLLEKMKELQDQVDSGELLPDRLQLEMGRAREQADQQIEQAYLNAMEQAGLAKQIPNIQIVTYQQLIEMGLIEAVPVSINKVCYAVVMGDQLLYKRVLPTDRYPIVPIVNQHTRTPYPVSDVRMVKGLQEYINKTRSLIIAHATTSTNMKVMIPQGSVDMKDFEEKWAQPGVGIEVDFDMGTPVVAQPSALPNALYTNEQSAKQDIDHQLGLFELMMGNSQSAPSTYKATISIDEFGQRKIKSKLADIEAGLVKVGQVAIDLMQQLYKTEKIIRVINPNNSMNEYVVNKRLYDDKTGEVQVFNDICVGKYDVQVVSGSTLPSNRYAELEFYMEAYKNGIVDRQEVLKKTEIFDMEGVMQRTDVIDQLQQQLEAAQEELKKLRGDLQTRDRESVNLRKKVEVEKFKGELDSISNKAKASGTIFDKRLDDTLSSLEDKVRESTKPADTSDKSSAKKRSK